MCERENLSHDFFSLAMEPTLDFRFYSGCIISGVQFHMIDRDFWRTTKNSGVLVVGENIGNGTANKNFYSVLDKVLSIQYSMETTCLVIQV